MYRIHNMLGETNKNFIYYFIKRTNKDIKVPINEYFYVSLLKDHAIVNKTLGSVLVMKEMQSPEYMLSLIYNKLLKKIYLYINNVFVYATGNNQNFFLIDNKELSHVMYSISPLNTNYVFYIMNTLLTEHIYKDLQFDLVKSFNMIPDKNGYSVFFKYFPHTNLEITFNDQCKVKNNYIYYNGRTIYIDSAKLYLKDNVVDLFNDIKLEILNNNFGIKSIATDTSSYILYSTQ